MKEFIFETDLWLPRPRAEIFAFFADAYNLQSITPDFLDFRIVTPAPIEMKVGTLIDYKLRVHGLPLRWRTRIAHWNPPIRFVDEQLRGPYRLWVHEHSFAEEGNGTLVRDRVRYAVLGGALVERIFVRRDVEKIFAHRTKKLLQRFAAEPTLQG